MMSEEGAMMNVGGEYSWSLSLFPELVKEDEYFELKKGIASKLLKSFMPQPIKKFSAMIGKSGVSD